MFDLASFKKLDKIWFLWLSALVIDIITLIFIRDKINPGGQTLALHYNVVFGVDWYGNGNNLYSIPFIGLAILFMNFVLYRALQKQQMFLAFLCSLISLFVEIILLLAVIFLARVN
jgi:hypothetical protein